MADCHAATGMYPIEYLDSIDYFTEGTVCAHCGWVTKKEMRILASHDALANPDPEILPTEINEVRSDAIIATGRSDFPNQINKPVLFCCNKASILPKK